MIIDKNQLSSTHNISNANKQSLHNNRPKLLFKDSSYLSMGHSSITYPQIVEIYHRALRLSLLQKLPRRKLSSGLHWSMLIIVGIIFIFKRCSKNSTKF